MNGNISSNDRSNDGIKILIVDDYPLNIELAVVPLEAEGYVVSTARTAEEAVTAIRNDPPQLILMDIQLPGMDGLGFTRRLKANPETSSIIVVAFTAYAMRGDEKRMLAAGCDGYIPKPIDVRTFAWTVRSFLPALAVSAG